MKRMWAAAVAVLLALSACGDGSTDETSASSAPASTTTAAPPTTAPEAVPGGPPVVTLEDPGVEPRSTLRLRLAAGTTASSTLTVSTAIDQELDGRPGQSVPPVPVSLGLTTTVDEVADGVITTSFLYDRAEVVGDGFDPALVQQIQSGIDSFVGTTGQLRVDERAALVDFRIDIPEGLDPNVATLVEQFASQSQSLTIPLPEESIGVGARWTASSVVVAAGLQVEVVTRYELQEVDGARYVLGVDQEQRAQPQAAEIPGVPSGTEVDLSAYDIRGDGAIEGDLAALLPVRSTLEAAGDQAFTVRAGGESVELSQHLELKVEITTP